jgi:1,4-dihydroxy-2-naphthoate octaprenyltransferase
MSRYNCNVVESVCHLRQVGGFLLVLWFPLPIKMSRYNCNVVESVCHLLQVGGLLLVLWFPLPIKMSRYNCNVQHYSYTVTSL